jgi:hypothetical protein
MHLRVSIYEMNEHAQTYMKRLGITYQHAVPQSITDQWWFFNCKDIPTPLPQHITELKPETGDVHEFIGWGLSKEEADAIQSQSDAATESGTPRGQAGNRAGPPVSPPIDRQSNDRKDKGETGKP